MPLEEPVDGLNRQLGAAAAGRHLPWPGSPRPPGVPSEGSLGEWGSLGSPGWSGNAPGAALCARQLPVPRRPVCFNLTVVFSVSSSPRSQKPPAPWQRLWARAPGRRVSVRDLELDFHAANEHDGGQNLRPLRRACPLPGFCSQCLGTGCSRCTSQRGIGQRDVTGSPHVGKGHRASAATRLLVLLG